MALGVQFEEETNSQGSWTENTTAGMTKWLINKGFAKSRRSAEIILIVVAVIFFIATGVVAYRSFGNPHSSDQIPILPQYQGLYGPKN